MPGGRGKRNSSSVPVVLVFSSNASVQFMVLRFVYMIGYSADLPRRSPVLEFCSVTTPRPRRRGCFAGAPSEVLLPSTAAFPFFVLFLAGCPGYHGGVYTLLGSTEERDHHRLTNITHVVLRSILRVLTLPSIILRAHGRPRRF